LTINFEQEEKEMTRTELLQKLADFPPDLPQPIQDAFAVLHSGEFTKENYERLQSLARDNPNYGDEIGWVIEGFIVAAPEEFFD
jgi:hypothetical protein